MQSQLKKTLYLGLAVLSLGSVAALSTNASAKTRTYRASSRVTASAYQTLKTDSTTRNVIATGTNALYDKPGTLRGAKVVASKATVAKLAATKSSADLFRAYGVKTTNRGSVYYRVVTMNGKYRGYIYGGKSTSEFAGGVKSFDTTKSASLPTQVNNYYLVNPSKNTLWTAPKYTQYKASKVSLYGASKTDKFTIDKAATKSLEGSLYYHVVDASNSAVSGWVYAGGLSAKAPAAQATQDNSVTVKYVDSSYNLVGSAQSYITKTDGTTKGNELKGTDLTDFPDFVNGNVPSGYQLASKYTIGTPIPKFGDTIQVQVVKTATSKVVFKTTGSTTTNTGTLSASDLAANAFPSLTSEDQKVFTGKAGDTIIPAPTTSTDSSASATAAPSTFSSNDLFTNGGKLAKLIGVTRTDADGNQYHYEYTFNAAATDKANAGAKYGDQIQLFYTVSESKVPVPSTASDSGNTNYVG